MPSGRAALATFVTWKMQQLGLSTRDVARRSGNVSNATVWNCSKGRTREITEDTLRGLAEAFEVSEAEVFAIYRGNTPEAEIDELRLVEYFKGLPLDVREDILLCLETLYKRHGKTDKPNLP
jgi:transcriptional regulator with XRE-family HTH domain